mgnify:CR=1 FL=1
MFNLNNTQFNQTELERLLVEVNLLDTEPAIEIEFENKMYPSVSIFI